MNMNARKDPISIVLTIATIAVFIFLFIPIVVIVIYSFNNGALLSAWRGFGFQAYQAAFANKVIRASVMTSVLSAVGSAILSTILGTLGGLALAKKGGALAAIVLTGLLGLTMVTPEIVDAVSILPWFVSLGTDFNLPLFDNGMARLIVAQTVVSVAVVTFIVRARMQGMDSSLQEASQDLYANKWSTFWRVTFPIAAPGIWAGALMAFTVGLDNTIVASFVQVPGSTPWPVYIFSALKVGLKPEIAAVSTLMLLVTLAILAVVAMVLKRSGSNTKEFAATIAGG